MLAVSARHVLGQHVQHLLPCPRPHMETKLQAVLTSGQAFTERELSLTTNDGHTVTVNCSAYPLVCEDTHRLPDLSHAHCSDLKRPGAEHELLVELYQVDRHLRISREEHLLSQHKATRAVIRSLAHEIKNPLGGLRGAAQLLEQELPDPALREYTQIIIAEADRLQTLLNQMLGPSRLPKRQILNIHQVLERVLSLVQAENVKLHIQRDYDPSIPMLHGDLDQLIQAVLNVARNGGKAASHGGGRLILRTRVLRQLTIGMMRHRLVLVVEVEDNGPGIPQEMQERIFLPLITGTEGGTGLGLSIAQDLISQHGGLIECRSKPQETIFSIYLPLDSSCD